MNRSPLLEFESSSFVVLPGEDEETNPGIYGKALAVWLAEQLQARRVSARDPIAEDFGWCVPVESSPHSLYVACASEDHEAQKWRVFVFAEGGFLARLLGKDKSTESVRVLFHKVKQILESSTGITGLAQVEA